MNEILLLKQRIFGFDLEDIILSNRDRFSLEEILESIERQENIIVFPLDEQKKPVKKPEEQILFVEEIEEKKPKFLFYEILENLYYIYFRADDEDERVKRYIIDLSLKGRMSLWKASTLRALESLTFMRGLGLSVETKEETDIDTLLKSNIIMELDALSNNDKIFFTEAFDKWIFFNNYVIMSDINNLFNGNNLDGTKTN